MILQNCGFVLKASEPQGANPQFPTAPGDSAAEASCLFLAPAHEGGSPAGVVSPDMQMVSPAPAVPLHVPVLPGGAVRWRWAIIISAKAHCAPDNSFGRKMSKEDAIEVQGTVVEKFPAGLFSVQLDQDRERVVLAHLAGKLRRNRIRVLAGDRVTLEMSPYDLTKGRITYRHK